VSAFERVRRDSDGFSAVWSWVKRFALVILAFLAAALAVLAARRGIAMRDSLQRRALATFQLKGDEELQRQMSELRAEHLDRAQVHADAANAAGVAALDRAKQLDELGAGSLAKIIRGWNS
jgi:hypothetical protein